jgi:RNA polymerase sigma-70 factor (ECF subfamily)
MRPALTDEIRFRALFDRTYPAVVRYAYNRGHRGPDAEDLVAATFEVAWRRLENVPDGEEATPWLLAVERNLSRNAGRRARRDRTVVEPYSEPEDVATSAAVEDGVAAREQLLGALAALKQIDRELILLVAWDGLDPAHAGEVLGLRAGAARSRLHRARNQLAALLGSAAGRAGSRRPAAAGCSSAPETKQEED